MTCAKLPADRAYPEIAEALRLAGRVKYPAHMVSFIERFHGFEPGTLVTKDVGFDQVVIEWPNKEKTK